MLRTASFFAFALALCLPGRAGADTYRRQPGIDVLHYTFRVTLNDDSSNITGETTIELECKQDGLAALVLDLATPTPAGKGMTVSAVTTAAGPVRFTHENNALKVMLEPAAKAGDKHAFTVRYQGVPASGLRIGANKFGERTFFSSNWPNLAHQWLPTVDHPSDKATSEMLITAPVKYQVVSNGLLEKEVDLADGNRLTHWKQSVPIATWLNTIGVAQFAVHHAGQVRGIPLSTWAYHQELEAGILTFEEPARRALEFYSDYIGPYPFEKMASVEAAGVSGGMEMATAIFYGERSVTMRPATSLVAHEIAHQWFGDSVTEADWDDVWLSEGFATYFALLYAEHYQGRDALVSGLKRSRDTILSLERRSPNLAVVHNNLADMSKVLDQLKYQKGSWTLHMLRGVLGDEKFQAGIREYYQRHRDSNTTSADLQRAMEKASGQDLAWFFSQWLPRPGSPKVDGQWTFNSQTKQLELALTQSTSQPYRLPLEVGITAADGRQTIARIVLDQAQQKFTLPAAAEPTTVTLDPNTWVLMTASLAKSESQPTAETADTIFTGGVIYTANDAQPRAEALAVKNGRILSIGSSADVAKLRGPQTRVVDLAGKTVLPGLADAHCHLSGVGAREINLSLEGVNTLDDFLAKVKTRVDQAPAGGWVTGSGWIETFWKPPVFPSRADLDRIAPNNPVWLTRADGHGAVANSAALKLAGVTRDTPAPFGGEIMKDRAGEPNGMLLDNAQGLVARLVPRPTRQEAERALVLGAQRSLSLGWTSLHVPSSSLREVEVLKRLYVEGQLKLRLDVALLGPSDDARRLLRDGPTLGAADGRLNCRAIKVSFDGALGSKGAALLDPYADHDTTGLIKWKETELLPMFEDALRGGVQLWTHAIGDRANREILNLYEKAFQSVPPEQRKVREPRWRVEHAQIVSAADIPRFARLGVLPSMQPSHAIGDLHFAESRLGLARLEGAYAWQSLLKAGSIIPGGSDAPVERGEPMIEFYAAVARKDLKGFSGPGWHGEQAVSREQALKMFTLWPAIAAFAEADRGTLEVGKQADLTVLTADIMTIPERQILDTTCHMTVIAGEIAYQAP